VKNAYKIAVRNQKESYCMGDLVVDGRIKLKYLSRTRVQFIFFWLNVGTN
jgi:hypothetical protein